MKVEVAKERDAKTATIPAPPEKPASTTPPVASTPPPAATPPPQKPPAPTPPPEPAPSSSQGTIGLALGAAGVVGLGADVFFGLKAKSTYDEALTHCRTTAACDPQGVSGGSDAHGQATVSTIAFVAGGALAATGVVLYLTRPRSNAVQVAPAVGVNAAGVSLRGAF